MTGLSQAGQQIVDFPARKADGVNLISPEALLGQGDGPN
jgi:hypothetical protein